MKIKAEKGKRDYSLAVYYLFLLLLSFLAGYHLKLIASRYLTVGFEDHLVRAQRSDYDFKEVEKKIEEMKKEMEEEAAKQEKAAQGAGGTVAPVSDGATPVSSDGGSCAQ